MERYELNAAAWNIVNNACIVRGYTEARIAAAANTLKAALDAHDELDAILAHILALHVIEVA